MAPESRGSFSDGTPALPAEMEPVYDSLIERTDAFAREHERAALVPLLHELARCVVAEGRANFERRTADEWARGIVLTAVIAVLIDESPDLASVDLHGVFLDAVGPDMDATAKCTADVLVSAGVLEIEADWTLPS